MWDTTSSHFFTFSERSIHIPLPPHSLVTNFPITFLPSPCPSSQTVGHNPWIGILLHVWLFLQVQWATRCAPLKFSLGGFSYTTVLRDSPDRGSPSIDVHFWVVLAYCEKPCGNQPQVFSSSVNWQKRTSFETKGSGWEREDSTAECRPLPIGPFLHITYLCLQSLHGLAPMGQLSCIPFPFHD